MYILEQNKKKHWDTKKEHTENNNKFLAPRFTFNQVLFKNKGHQRVKLYIYLGF